MNITEFFNLFLILSSVYGFIFSSILFFSKNGKEKSMVYLNFLILVISFNNFQSWMLAKSIIIYNYTVQIPWHFLIGPFFYMFLAYYIGVARKIKKFLYGTLAFFFSLILGQILFLYYREHIGVLDNLKTTIVKYNAAEEVFSLIVSISLFSYSFFILMKKDEQNLTNISSNKYRWIYIFFKIGLICYISWIIAVVVKINMGFSGFMFSYYPLRVATTVLIFWLGYQAIIQLQICKDRYDIRKALMLDTTKEEVISDKEVINSDFFYIEDYIIQNKRFTDPLLSRDTLAKEMDIGKNKLSTLVNSATEKTFTEYINQLRVNLAKKLLRDNKYKNYTIASIGLESGFNSKSTFYYVFKKNTGKTPLQYKKESRTIDL